MLITRHRLRMFALLGIVLLMFALLGIVLLRTARSPKVQRTIGKEQSWFTNFFAQHILSIVREGDSVRFVSDGQLGVDWWGNPNKPWTKTFSLPESGEFARPPDHHASASFKVTKIEADGVIVEYTSRFDHRSFGKNLITIDTGTVKLPYRKAQKKVEEQNHRIERDQ